MEARKVIAETANGLKKFIVDTLNLKGHPTHRNNSRYLANRKPSKTEVGVPDVVSCIFGHFVGFEVKIDTDKQSEGQREYQKRVEADGGIYLVVKTRDEFLKLYDELLDSNG